MSMSKKALPTGKLYSRGNRNDFTKVYNQFYQALVFFANRLLNDHETAQDAVVDVFVKLWENDGDFESLQNLKGWLYITTRNHCYNLQSRQNSRDKYAKSIAKEPTEEAVEVHIANAEVLRAVMWAIDNLPPKCRNIFRLSYLEGLNNHEIAARLGLSFHTIKNQKVRGLMLLRERLRKDEFFVFVCLFIKYLN